VVDSFSLHRNKHANAWLVQLSTGTKRKVVEVVEAYLIDMDGNQTQVVLNILPIVSYDGLLWIDWLSFHKEKLNCYEKIMEYQYEKGNARIFQGI
jgi:hypothetical protein